MCKSGLATINRSLAQARVVSCITRVLVWLGGFHIGAVGTEDEFTVTASSGIRDRDVRVAEIVARELEILTAEVWQGCWKQQLRREEVRVGRPQVRGVQGAALWER